MKLVRGDAKGFTILEVIIAGGLMMGLAMVLLQMNTIQQRGIMMNEAQNESVNLSLQVFSYLKDVRSCNATISGAIGVIDSEGNLETKSPVPLKSIDRLVRNAKREWDTIPALRVGDVVGNKVLKIRDIKVRFRPAWDGFVDLVVAIEKTKKDPSSAQEKVFPLAVELVALPITPEEAEKKILPKYKVGCAGTSLIPVGSGESNGMDMSGNENPYGSTGFARDSTVKALEKACEAADGKWIAIENRCANAHAR